MIKPKLSNISIENILLSADSSTLLLSDNIKDSVKDMWKKSKEYKKILINYINNAEKDIYLSTEYRVRGIILSGDEPFKFLLMEKKAKIPYYELSYKGGHEFLRDFTTKESFLNELKEEVLGKSFFLKDNRKIYYKDSKYDNLILTYIGPYIDIFTEKEHNSDIMIRLTSSKIKKISFIANYILHSNIEFNVFDINEKAYEEHSSFKWVDFDDAQKELFKSALIGKDRDYYCLKELVKYIKKEHFSDPPLKINKYVLAN